eukprot:CAMPEP_0203859150 /NCGR_PEP_ID=MMETSP0359-20131031/11676_1 /ASSEMBLY_ACC=CAM_ASM_000338 /TAXON_ID=268821 /ORGANISM="Scrippsiella Hangoei, Strain SHTV-5" /LENGTH=235 /DNA_ID=CAMNT_0050776009 /DNA_START=132 /DNA_END=839 /DNA_ORIENTATION=-
MERFELKKEEILAQQEAFNVLDTDGSGMITMDDLRAFNEQFHAGFTAQELEDQFSEIDLDGNGGISFLEYLKVYVKGEYGREVHIGLEHIESATPLVSPRRSNLMSMKCRDRTGSQSNLAAIVEVRSSGDLLGEASEKSEASPDRLEMKLSGKRSIGFNIRAAALFLRGTEDKPSVPSLRISALGGVIAAAAAVAASVESEGLGRIVKVQTAYLERPSGRACPQIFIDIDRVAKA